MEETDNFDAWLERELKQAASVQTGPHPLPAQARYQVAFRQPNSLMNLVLAVRPLASTRAAAAAGLAVLAVVAAGAIAEAAITRTADPSNWGHQVVLQVQKCKAALAPGGHGIGECVSSLASQHGKQDRGTNAAKDDPKHTPAPPSTHPSGGGASGGNPGGGNPGGGNPGGGNPGGGNPGGGNSNSGNHLGVDPGVKPDMPRYGNADTS